MQAYLLQAETDSNSHDLSVDFIFVIRFIQFLNNIFDTDIVICGYIDLADNAMYCLRVAIIRNMNSNKNLMFVLNYFSLVSTEHFTAI